MDKDTISRFIRQTCTPEEELEVVQWLASPHSKKELQEIIESDLKSGLEGPSTEGIDLSRIRKEILAKHTEHRRAHRTRRFWSSVLKTAASLLLLAASVFVLHIFLSRKEVPQQAETTPGRVMKSNQKGRKSTIFLPDGSTVNLNSESRITYPESFVLARRVVHLEGEAFFVVAENADKPFVVKTKGLSIRALGTSFNVRAYEGSDKVKITLATGKVEICERTSNTISERPKSLHDDGFQSDEHLEQKTKTVLLPGQSVIFDNESHIFSAVENFNPREEFGWKEGIIHFKKAGWQEVFSTLERWYNVEFLILNNPANHWSHNGEYQNMTLKQILRQMAFTEGIEYAIQENQIQISFKQ